MLTFFVAILVVAVVVLIIVNLGEGR